MPEGRTAHRRVPLRIAAGQDLDRVYRVQVGSVDGGGSARAGDDEFTVSLPAGRSTLVYTVDGAVAQFPDSQEVRWQVASGWDVPLDSVTASLIAPNPPKAVTCLAGPPNSSQPCTAAQLTEGQDARAREISLAEGERVDLAVALPQDTVPANARVEQALSLAAAFALTPLTGVGLAVLLVVLLGGVVLLWYARGRDVRAMAGDVAPVRLLVDLPADQPGGAPRVAFASPDGVLPGQVGTVVDEHVDVVDVTATVIDLAVRNYLWIEEVGEPLDWRVVRRNPADDALTGYERAVYRALLPDGTDQVLLSELRGRRLDLAEVRTELYQDVVARQWFARRPDAERSLWWWAGIGLGVAGAALTTVLALTAGHALFGLAVVVAGAALAVGARWMPARTRRGSALLEQVRGLREHLHVVSPTDIPEPDRELVFSRSLPYAVVLGAAEHWLAAWAELDADADGAPGLYWFGEQDGTGQDGRHDLRRFAARFPIFLRTLDGVLAEAGHLRSLRS